MKTFYSIKNNLKILDIVSESGFVLQFFEATINLVSMDFLWILGNQYIIESDLSISLMFRSNLLRYIIFAWIISSMECVAFEYVLDFELERPLSAKSLEM